MPAYRGKGALFISREVRGAVSPLWTRLVPVSTQGRKERAVVRGNSALGELRDIAGSLPESVNVHHRGQRFAATSLKQASKTKGGPTCM